MFGKFTCNGRVARNYLNNMCLYICAHVLLICVTVCVYSRRQNKVLIAERLPNDFTREFNGKIVDKFTC